MGTFAEPRCKGELKMSRSKEEILKELEEIEAKERQQQPTDEKIDLKKVELVLKANLRLLKDKEMQINKKFGKGYNIMELDPNRRDNQKTINQLRNEIDELNYNIDNLKALLHKDRITQIDNELKSED
jgi:hypothetical protein